MKILPTTPLGKWAVMLLAGCLLVFIFTTVVIVGLLHQQGGNTFTDNLSISIPMLSSFVLAMMTSVTGIVGVWKYHERSLLVYVPIIVGLVITLFVLGEPTTHH